MYVCVCERERLSVCVSGECECLGIGLGREGSDVKVHQAHESVHNVALKATDGVGGGGHICCCRDPPLPGSASRPTPLPQPKPNDSIATHTQDHRM